MLEVNVAVLLFTVRVQLQVQNLLAFRLSKNIKIKIYRTVILPVVVYGYETSSLTWMVFENRVMRIFGPKRDGSGENYIMRSLMIGTTRQILFG
jgi:hypothetical protein